MRPLLFILIASSTLAAQTRERFEFRGLHLGDSLTSDLVRDQRLNCRKVGPGESCEAADKHVAGVTTFWVSAETIDRKISGFRIDFGARDFGAIQDAFTARWGKPDSVETRDWQNRAGAKFPNRVVHWNLGDGALEVSQLGPSMTTGEVSIDFLPLVDIQAKRRACAAAKAALKDLGGKLPEGCSFQ
jgi:hypothetical protein